MYAPVHLELDLAARSLAAFEFARDKGGVLVGYSAAALLGADCAPLDAPAEVAVAVRTDAQPGLRIVRARIEAGDVAARRACRVTTPLRTAWDLARRLDLVEAVVAVDALARKGRFAPSELLARRANAPAARGCRRLDEVVALANPRAESPMETRLRLALCRADLPTPRVQYQVCDKHDYVVARVDLAYPAAKLAVEYDGAIHYDPIVHERDRRRDNDLADLGWHVMHLCAQDALPSQMQHTVARIRALLEMRTLRGG